eukprot:COSAG01_NODE_23205_length_824_cov_1.040000_1_plen_82_part_10
MGGAWDALVHTPDGVTQAEYHLVNAAITHVKGATKFEAWMNETRRVADKAQVLRFKSWMRDRQASDNNIAYEEAEAMLAEVD